MDACNFPEFLALDLETAEPIFAAKRMTAGPPRALGAIGSPEVIQHPDLLSSELMARFKDDAKSTATAAVPATGKDRGHAELPMDGAQGDSETDSIDSFIATNNKSASLLSRRTEPLCQEHMLEPDEQASRSSRNGARSDHAHSSSRNTNSRISHRTRDSYASYEGYGSLFGDYDYADDYDNYTIPSDAESVSSFGVSVPTSSRGRQQSIVTAATSVASSDRHASVQSHILSAMGPFSPVCEPRHSGQSARSAASLGRRVEFSLDTDSTDDRSVDVNDGSAPRHISISRSSSDRRRQRHAEDAPAAAAIRRVLGEIRTSDESSSREERSSWLNFADDGSDDGCDNDSKSNSHAFKANAFFRNAAAADQLPKPSHRRFSRSASGRCRNDLSPGPRTGDLALRRRSSLDSGQLKEWMGTSSNLQQRRRLRHVAPLRELSVLRDAAAVGAPSRIGTGGAVSPILGEPGSDSRAVPPVLLEAGSAVSSKTVDEVPIVLPKTVYAPANQPSPAIETLRSYFDEESEDECAEAEGTARRATVTSRFDDFNDADDEVLAPLDAAKPFSRSAFGSIRSVRSRLSLSSTAKPSFESSAIACDADPVNAEKTSEALQGWVGHAADQQKQKECRLPPSRPATGHALVAPQQMPLAEEEDDAVPALPQPFDYSSFYHPGVVGIPLPRDVVETLRVSVSCFPETMLSLSSFTIQTIRSYSRKVRRCSPSDADSTFRLLMTPEQSPSGVQLNHKTETLSGTSQLLPLSSNTASLRTASRGTDTELRRTATSMSGSTTASHRFWRFKRLGSLRPSSSCNSLGGADSALSARPPSQHLRNLGRDSNSSELPLSDDGQGKSGGACFKRIFPTGSDYLCDALYAHIIAFNYISLLCPPAAADAKPVSQEPAAEAPSEANARPWTPSCNTIATTSTATLIENSDKAKRQTIRIYMDSNVALDIQEDEPAMLESPPPSPPPSRGRPDDGNRLISRKAASLLGITELLEPDMSNNQILAKRSHQSVGSGLARRYHTMRQRHHRATGSSSTGRPLTASNETATTKKPAVAAATKKPLEISKPLPVQPASVPEETVSVVSAAPAVPAATLTTSVSMPAVSAVSAPSDTHLRDLQAGLHHCICRLVSTLKLTTGQLDSATLLTAETARELDPLFLRMLCELVRSQEEPI